MRHERLTVGSIRAVHITMLALCALQGYAVKVGMMVGRGELLLFMDADGATRVSDIEKLEAALAAVSESGRLCNLYWRNSQGYLERCENIGRSILPFCSPIHLALIRKILHVD